MEAIVHSKVVDMAGLVSLVIVMEFVSQAGCETPPALPPTAYG